MSKAELSKYVALSPQGRILEIPGYVFEALCEFVDDKKTGSVQVNFMEGGFSSAEANFKKSFRNGNGNGNHPHRS